MDDRLNLLDEENYIHEESESDVRISSITEEEESNHENQNNRANDNQSFTCSAYRNLKVYICTWNVNTKNPSFDLSELLSFDKKNSPDLCAFGFQEVNSGPVQRIMDYFFNDPWTNKLTSLMNKLNYVQFKSTRLVGILLIIFTKRPLLPFIKHCTDDWIRLGFWGLWGNKGANLFTFNVSGLNICLVNSHLCAHEDKDKARLLEHAKIMYHKIKLANTSESVDSQDYLFFFGDLNFRVQGIEMERIIELLDEKNFTELLKHDQLNVSMPKEDCFSLLVEQAISFPPTYKFKIGSNTYETHRNSRKPSWCDRILYKMNKTDNFINCKSLDYYSLPQFTQSDHRPVCGLFEIKVLNWELEAPSVVFRDIKANENQNLQVSYQVNKDMFTHKYDYIALYHPNFSKLDDYVTYAWAPRIYELEFDHDYKNHREDSSELSFYERKIEIDQYYVNSGFYLLGYFSYVCNCLIGVSSIFELKLS